MSHQKLNRLKPIRLVVGLIMAIALSTTALAQHSIKGRLIDEEKQPLPFAHVVLLSPVDSTLKYFDVSDKKGEYEIRHIRAGQYLMQYSFVTKKTVFDKITIPTGSEGKLGDKMLMAAPSQGVIVEAEYVPIQFKQDTVSFNAKAFKTKVGAVVEDLLKKIPGLEVDNSGNIKALGEDVKRVLVDGKEFFGSDTKVATKNLPAMAIDKVEIFDKQSEDAEFSGINDGVLDRTINLLLNEDNKKGYFGNVEAGGGTDEHYKADGKLYRFSSSLQTALLANVNNINEFGFTGKGHGQFGQGINGLNTTAAGGINLSLNTKKPNRYFFSYLASTTQTELLENTSTEHFIKGGSYFQHEDLTKDSRNTPHKINLGVRHQFNKRHKITLDGNINIDADNENRQLSVRTLSGDTLTNTLDNITETTSDLINASFHLSDIIKINGEKSMIKTKASALYNKSTSNLDWQNTTTLFNAPGSIIDNQFQDNVTERARLTIIPTWTQRLRPFWYIDFEADLGFDRRSMDKGQGVSGQNNILTDSLSAEFNTMETWTRPGITLRRATSKSQLSLGIKAGRIQFEKDLDGTALENKSYDYIYPSFRYSNSYQTGRRIALKYWTHTQMPSLNQLLPVTNTLNPLVLYQGDAMLTPEYRHNVTINWSIFDHFSFTSMFARLYCVYTKNKISMAQTIHENFSKTVRPVNVDEDFLIFGMVNVSTPVRRFGIKISGGIKETFRKGISLINSEENRETTITHQIDLNVENRRKELFHLKVGGSLALTSSKYSIADEMDNIYYNTTIYSDFQLTVSERWNIEAEVDIVNYNAQSFKETVSVPLIQAGISYHFLQANRATLTIKGYDLLNKFTNFQRISNVNYLMEKEKNTIGRYIMLTLKYRTGK
ncbi:outer membrane beta-barrel protein [bacterium]|nr:outer membrane beta-barrel protein [bacterium]